MPEPSLSKGGTAVWCGLGGSWGRTVMIDIRLPRGAWTYDPEQQLGPEGGFGVVFAGESATHGSIAVKKLKMMPGGAGHRELRIADEVVGRQFSRVVPVFDAGRDTESGDCFVVMARAERSLQALLDEGRIFGEGEAVGVLVDVLRGLEEVGDVVHRDLKPANILLHDGVWKVADFSIARFVEDSTSLQTLRDCLSPPYAAPEQWRFERASPATDLYALGCTGYALLTGRPPFTGPSHEDFEDGHLHGTPPVLEGVSPGLANLLYMLLRKSPGARPGRARVRSLLERAAGAPDVGAVRGLAELSEAGAAWERQAAGQEAERQRARDRAEGRAALAVEAASSLERMVDDLFARIADTAPNAARRGAHAIELGRARLQFDLRDARCPIDEGVFENWGWDVVAGAKVAVHQSEPEYGWSASLWYAKPPSEESYRWWEVSYCAHAFARHPPEFEPFALDPGRDADFAGSTIMHSVGVAFGPRAMDDEDLADFIDRWAALFASAVKGLLRRPSSLPIG
jgi:serine/threonine-protein kinase